MRWQVGRSAAAALAMLALLVLALVTVPVPFVAIGRGPTFDTLGTVNGSAVVGVRNLPTYPTSGHLNMTTVGVTDGLSGLQAIRVWASRDQRLVPRVALVRPGETTADAAARNARLFLDSQDAAEAAALGHLGLPTLVVVGEVLPDGPATGALEPGDVVLTVAGRPMTGVAGLRTLLAELAPGQQVAIGVQRPERPAADVMVTVGANPRSAGGYLGIVPVARPVEDNIDFTLGDVGGPSAGLMFALAAVDKLTPGELTGGRFVAGTGTIDSVGTVREIEGIRFKMAAAREAGATVFLVPGGNCEEAVPAAPEGLQIVRVDDLAGAVAALDTLRAGGTPPTC